MIIIQPYSTRPLNQLFNVMSACAFYFVKLYVIVPNL